MKLINPSKKYYQSYIDAINESEGYFKYASETFYLPKKEDLFVAMNNSKRGINLPSGYVKSTYLWLIDKNEFIGMINIRHELNESLRHYGGHIGYQIRYQKWNQGYGSYMLKKALVYCKKKLNLKEIMISCDNLNIGSSRVIEKNGGKLEDIRNIIVEGKEIQLRRYWINL